ncbi:hypothetical protein Nepgr_002086 [Nepenthes gracilis]|uniref:Uncharacterized protein n=1 Tax=Nepenthes gracilis TaxID=150966 RepID=A0AAD3P9J6_NEPGR|nr:hypothetical protein Nepgr_002086 [Nepenthes gracilis]
MYQAASSISTWHWSSRTQSRAELSFSRESHGNITKEASPVSMMFTIAMYNASRLQIAKKLKSYNPYRWVRYVECYPG